MNSRLDRRRYGWLRRATTAALAWWATFLLCLSWAPVHSAPVNKAAPAEEVTQPKTCVMGVYLQDMRDYKFADRSLFASLRLWSVCPDAVDSPLQDLNVIHSNDVAIGEIETKRVPNESGFFPDSPFVFWSIRTVEGSFFHHWSAVNFPFDRHTITFEFESVSSDVSRFVITPDYIHSGYSTSINDGDWIASGFSINEVKHSYGTNFGKPERNPKDGGSYSRIRVSITLQRARLTSFIKLCTGVYAAVIIAGLTFLMDVREPDIVSGRTGLLVGCLFAAIVNMQQAESTLGLSEDITLTDKLHILSILYILVASLLALLAYLRCESGREDFARRMDRTIYLPIFLSSFAVVNAVVIAYSAIIG